MLLDSSWLITLAAALVIIGISYSIGTLLDILTVYARSRKPVYMPTSCADIDQSSAFLA